MAAKPGSVLWWGAQQLYRSRWCARWLFGVNFLPLEGPDHHFDVTTIALVRRAAREVAPETRVIDLGTGSRAVIGLSLWKRSGCHVTAVDVNPDVLALARANIEHNRAPIRTVESELFENVPEDFDLVVFNPPYVPTAHGLDRLSEARRSQWDGGPDGLDVVRRFLDALCTRTHPLRCCLGVNVLHANHDAILEAIGRRDALALLASSRHPVLPVRVYICDKP